MEMAFGRFSINRYPTIKLSINAVDLLGGGNNPMPGEIYLAHHGVLFLDDFPDFSRQVPEVLRQPIEERELHTDYGTAF